MMEFPAYVPAAVRVHLTKHLDGDDWEPTGWRKILADAEQRLSEIEEAIETTTRRGEVEYLDGLRKQKAEAVEHRNQLAGEVDCLQRLAYDSRMQDAYSRLAQVFTSDKQWRDYILAAWAARINYSEYRDRQERVRKLRDKIAIASEKLAGLLRETSDTGFPFWPSEFYSIPELLRQTDNHEMQNHNLHMWRSLRGRILGDLPNRDVPESEPARKGGESAEPVEIVFQFLKPGEKPEIDPEEEARNVLRYAWNSAPILSELLDTVTKSARGFKPIDYGMVGAALASQKRNVKTEYLRAFGSRLTDIHGFTLTTGIMNAMAVTANVVINQAHVDVSYDDVRKALATLGG